MFDAAISKAGKGLTIYTLAPPAVLYLYFNIVVRLNSLYRVNTYIDWSLIPLFIVGILICVYPVLLKKALFLFGLSFFLFGFRPYDIESQFFDLLTILLSAILLTTNLITRSKTSINQNMGLLLCSYVILSVSSICLITIPEIGTDFSCFGVFSFFNNVFNAIPSSSLYMIGGLNRLLLYSLFCYQLSVSNRHLNLFSHLFQGIFIGAILASVLGILDIYNLLDLSWYRHNEAKTVLHSTFLNRGWFSEYIVIVIPYCLTAFMAKKKSFFWQILLFGFLIICEIALLLSGARAGWVSYPLVLLVCWSFIYIYRKENFKFSDIKPVDYIKVVVSMPITILVSALLLYFVLGPLSEITVHSKREISDSDSAAVSNQLNTDALLHEEGKTKDRIRSNFETQLARLFNAAGRIEVWKHGLAVGFEKPLLGMGYETFSWHGNILNKIKDSYYYQYTSRRVQDTPHNLYIQLFDNGGIVGLILWFCIIGYALIILLADLVVHKKFFNAAVIVSILSAHFIGVFQSLQYIPMIWLIVFVNLGYALKRNSGFFCLRIERIFRKISLTFLIIACISPFLYYQGAFSKTLRLKYNLEEYSRTRNQQRYYGFYNPEKRPDGIFRWTGKHGLLKMQAKTDYMGFTVIAHDLNSIVEKNGLQITILLNREVLDRIHFDQAGRRDFYYYCPSIENKEIELEFLVDRTFNPRKDNKTEDYRDLGIAVSEIQFFDHFPVNSSGLYPKEKRLFTIGPFDPEELPDTFRWTGPRATFQLTNAFGWNDKKFDGEPFLSDSVSVYLLCGHPDISRKPVDVSLFAGKELVKRVHFSDNRWQSLKLPNTFFRSQPLITVIVSRTWNPGALQISHDNRNLGVAIAVAFANNEKE